MSEPWEDGDEYAGGQPGLPPGLAALLGRKPTPEQQAQADADEAERLDAGDRKYPSLVKFENTPVCPKCTGTTWMWAWCPGGKGKQPHCQEEVGRHEHLHRQCERCGFLALSRTADTPDEAVV